VYPKDLASLAIVSLGIPPMTTMTSKNLPPPSDDDPATQVFDVDQDTPAAAVPDSGEGGKLKMIVSLLKRCLGVKDIAAM
jgi:oxysterol-binding protein-related protein 9/10/11